MSILVVCDVCGDDTPYQTWIDKPGIQMEIPDVMLGDVGESTQGYMICSWKCVLELATEMADPTELAQAIDDQVEEREALEEHTHLSQELENEEEEERQTRKNLRPVTKDPGIHIDYEPGQTLADYLAQGGGPAASRVNPVRRR